MIDGEIEEIPEIFRPLWKFQIYNVNVLAEEHSSRTFIW